jgi:hypothetical protein
LPALKGQLTTGKAKTVWMQEVSETVAGLVTSALEIEGLAQHFTFPLKRQVITILLFFKVFMINLFNIYMCFNF